MIESMASANLIGQVHLFMGETGEVASKYEHGNKSFSQQLFEVYFKIVCQKKWKSQGESMFSA